MPKNNDLRISSDVNNKRKRDDVENKQQRFYDKQYSHGTSSDKTTTSASPERGKSKLTNYEWGRQDNEQQRQLDQSRRARKEVARENNQKSMPLFFKEAKYGGTYIDAYTFLNGLPEERKRALKKYIKDVQQKKTHGDPVAPNQQVADDYEKYNDEFNKKGEGESESESE